MDTTTTEQEELERGTLEIHEEQPEQREERIHHSDRIPPRPPRDEYHRRLPERGPGLPTWIKLLLAILTIGASMLTAHIGGRVLADALNELEARGR